MEAGKTKLSDKIIKLDLVDAMIRRGSKKCLTSRATGGTLRVPNLRLLFRMFTANSMNCLTEALGLSAG